MLPVEGNLVTIFQGLSESLWFYLIIITEQKYAKHEPEHIETLQKLIHGQMLKQYRDQR